MGKIRDVRYGKEQVLLGRPAPSAERVAATNARFSAVGRLLLAALAVGAVVGSFVVLPWDGVDDYSGGYLLLGAVFGALLALLVQLVNVAVLRAARRLGFDGRELRIILTGLPTLTVAGLFLTVATASGSAATAGWLLLLGAAAALLTWVGAWFAVPWCLAPLEAHDARVSAAAATQR